MKVIFEMYNGSKYAYTLPEWFADLPREAWKQAAHDILPHVEGIISGFCEIPARVKRAETTRHIMRAITEYLPYVLAALAGFFFLTVLMAIKGYNHVIDGRDILNAVLCFAFCYTVKKLIHISKSSND